MVQSNIEGMNNFKYSLDNKRYHTFNYYVKNKFGCKVFKVSLNSNLSCPNRDGTKGVGGCTFCSLLGSGEFAGNANDDLTKQFNDVKEKMHVKWKEAKYIGYFQAYTNTYAPVQKLREMYEEILKINNVVGLHIATRADAISDEVIEYLVELNDRTDLWVELGLQSSNDKTAVNINRCHTFEEFKKTVLKLKSRGIKVCAHIINGLEGESTNDMIQTVKDLNALSIDGIKIHMLHIIKNTKIQKQFESSPFNILTLEQYVEITSEQLRYLDPRVVIFRITGDASIDDLVAPLWTLKKVVVTNEIDKYMRANDIVQGDMVNS